MDVRVSEHICRVVGGVHYNGQNQLLCMNKDSPALTLYLPLTGATRDVARLSEDDLLSRDMWYFFQISPSLVMASLQGVLVNLDSGQVERRHADFVVADERISIIRKIGDRPKQYTVTDCKSLASKCVITLELPPDTKVIGTDIRGDRVIFRGFNTFGRSLQIFDLGSNLDQPRSVYTSNRLYSEIYVLPHSSHVIMKRDDEKGDELLSVESLKTITIQSTSFDSRVAWNNEYLLTLDSNAAVHVEDLSNGKRVRLFDPVKRERVGPQDLLLYGNDVVLHNLYKTPACVQRLRFV